MLNRSPAGDAGTVVVAPSHLVADGQVVRATAADLSYVVGLQKQNHAALGFIPRVALAEKIALGRIWLARENDEPAGYLHHGSLAAAEVRIFQAAIQFDARRRHHGLALVASLVHRAQASGARAVSLRCLDFLDANDFWTAAGFSLLTTESGARGLLNVWGCRIAQNDSLHAAATQSPSFRFHSRLHACPRCGTATMDTWTRGAVRRRLCTRCVARGLGRG
jgi:hypothetical protein